MTLKSSTNVMVTKWKGRREILLLITIDSAEMIEVRKRNKIMMKPSVVLSYNKGKAAIDLADQLASYNSPLRKSLKWFRKVAIDMICNVAIVNAHYLFSTVTNKKISITDFRSSLVNSLVHKKQDNSEPTNVSNDHKRRKLIEVVVHPANKPAVQNLEGNMLNYTRQKLEPSAWRAPSTFAQTVFSNKIKQENNYVSTILFCIMIDFLFYIMVNFFFYELSYIIMSFI